jgi:hypothetical protein
MLNEHFYFICTYRHLQLSCTGAETGTFKPSKDNNAGVNYVSYQDVAVCLLEALDQKDEFNRSMMGVAPK